MDFTWFKSLGSLPSENKVINIKNKYYEMVTYFLGIDIGVRMTSRKSVSRRKLSILAYQAEELA
jgi:hypothetical protein